MVGNYDKRLLTFRADDVQYIIRKVQSGNSCILVGVDGIGKTSLLRHLLSPVVLAHYLGEEKDRFTFLSLDARALPDSSALTFYRHMALLLEPLLPGDLVLSSTDERSLAAAAEDMARKRLFDYVDTFLAQNRHCILVFVLDGFDIAFTETEPYFLRILLALRRSSGERVCYVAIGRNIPALICDSLTRKAVRETFPELFNGNIHGIKPLALSEARAMMEQGLRQPFGSYPTSLRHLPLEITGAHPGLLNAALAVLKSEHVSLSGRDLVEPLISRLLQDTTIVSQCEQIWYSLSDSEQYYLQHMQRGLFLQETGPPLYTERQMQDALRALLLKGVLKASVEAEAHHDRRNNKTSYQCFSSLFAFYVAQQFSTGLPGLQIDPSRQQVWIDGKLQTSHLTTKEFRLLRFLAECTGKICSREETTRAVYNETYSSKRDDARLDALVERTRKKIGDDSRPPRFLETIRSNGHRLNEYRGEHS